MHLKLLLLLLLILMWALLFSEKFQHFPPRFCSEKSRPRILSVRDSNRERTLQHTGVLSLEIYLLWWSGWRGADSCRGSGQAGGSLAQRETFAWAPRTKNGGTVLYPIPVGGVGDPNPDPHGFWPLGSGSITVVRGTGPRIRIRTKMSRIPNTACRYHYWWKSLYCYQL